MLCIAARLCILTAGDVCAARESENVDLVAWAIEAHEEAVPAYDMLVKGRAHGAILSFHVPGTEARAERGVGQGL